MSRKRKLLVFGAVVLVANVVAAVIAVILNLPSQFGQVGTDAGADVLSKGTAISAPLLPVALLTASLLLVRAGGPSPLVGTTGAAVIGALFVIGGFGELTAKGTADTGKAVLVGAGLVWVGIGLTLIVLAAQAFREHRAGSS